MPHLPPPLAPGARVAVVAPSSAPFEAAWAEDGVRRLRAVGFEVVGRRTAWAAHGYLCGDDAARLAELNAALGRDDLDALFCLRGGYGALRLLPGVDYAALRRRPKLIVGYSDITALQLACYARAGVPSLSGPMVAADWRRPDPVSEALFWPHVSGAAPYPLENPDGAKLRTLRPGRAEGVLLGGNLTLITRLVGTPYLPDLSGAILFFEEVGEQPYRLDGMLAQLRLAGVLDRLAGVVVGGLTGWEPPPDRPTLTPDEVLAHYFGEAPYPVATGLAYGHFPAKCSVPIGVRAALAAGPGGAELVVLESAVGAAA